jgi:hypothetical protein
LSGSNIEIPFELDRLMRDVVDLDAYPLHLPGSQKWNDLVEKCRRDLAENGMFNLEGFVKPQALARCMDEIRPVMETLSFVHRRSHNIYFRKDVPGLESDHPALHKVDTVNHTVC